MHNLFAHRGAGHSAVAFLSTTIWIALPMLAATTRASDGSQRVVVSPAQEVALGEKAREEFLSSHSQTTDGNLAIRVDEIGRAVAKISDRPSLLYRFLVVQGDELQAYSFPGGTVCITEGLVALYETDDALAFILAHEVAHVALRHQIFKYRLAQGMETDKPPARLMLETVMSRFDEEQEMEADRYGALYAVRAGYRFTAAQETVERLIQASHGPRSDRQHPDYALRLEALRQFRNELERSIEAFRAGTEALRAARLDNAIGALQYFVAEFPQSVSGRVNLGAAYLARVRQTAPLELAEALPILPEAGIVIRGGYDRVALEEARLQFELALREEPDQPEALAGLALVHVRLDELDLASEYLERALELEPDTPELLLCLANVRFLAGDYGRAVSGYAAALELRAGWPEARKNLAMTYEKLRQTDVATRLWTGLLEDPKLGREARRRLDALTRAASSVPN